MKAERWQVIEEIYHSASDLPEAKQDSFLQNACGEDHSLFYEVESLLKYSSTPQSLLDTPAIAVMAKALACDEYQSAAASLLGTSVGHYRILERIGSGGMGVVYKAEDLKLRRYVAVKLLPQFLAGDAQSLRRFEQEAQAASALNHPNICTIYEIGEAEGAHFIAIELLDGETLKERMTRGALEVPEIMSIAIQICDALEAAHSVGIIHRDVKPSNIILTRRGIAKIVDFGVAKRTVPELIQQTETLSAMLPRHANLRLTAPGGVIGTVAYMSPEQTAGQVDARSDLFSLGAVLYEMATQVLPFRGDSSSEVFESILNQRPELPRLINPKLPATLEKIILKLLEKDRDQRYQHAAEVRNDCAVLKRDIESTATPTRHRWGTLFIFVSLAVLLLGIVAYKIQMKPAKPLGSPRMTRLTTSGNVQQAAISPDGRYVAYLQKEKGYEKWSLMFQQVATSEQRQLVPPNQGDSGGYKELKFSSDGAYLYYSRMAPNSSKPSLYRVSVTGGTPEKLRAAVPERFALSPDGKSIAYLSSDPEEERDTLFVDSVKGSNKKVIAKLPQGANYFGPAWSPDARLLAIAEDVPGDALLSHILVVSLGGGAIRRITSDEFCIIHDLEWLKDGTGLIGTAVGRKVISNGRVEYEGKRPELWMFPYPGGTAHRITNDLFNYSGGASTSNDSRVLATVASDLVSAIWVGPASDPDQASPITPLAGHRLANRGLSWTGTGKIVYWSNVSDAFDLIVVDDDGRNPLPLPRDLPHRMDPDACSDGYTLVYTAIYANKRQVIRQNLDGGSPQSLTPGWRPQCSPDSTWVLYYDNRSVDVPRRIPIEGGRSIALADDVCSRAGISPDGRWVACVDGSEKLAIIPAYGGKPVKLFDLPSNFDRSIAPVRWTPDGHGVVYAVDEGGFENLWVQPVAGGPRRALTHFTSQEIEYFAFSHDGKQIAIGRGTPSSDVVLISNFR
jgi:eukaryotic-like serine/threonine-protein kinase